MIPFQDRVRIGIWLRKLETSRYRPSLSYLQLPYRSIGQGVNRKVFDIGNGNVLKVAISKRGIQDIIVETQLWKKAPTSIRRYLAKVKQSGSGWLIMKKYPRLVPYTSAYDQKIYKMMRKFRQHGYEPSDLVSNSTKRILRKNLRLRSNGACIVIDYGFFYKLSKQVYQIKQGNQNIRLKQKKHRKHNKRKNKKRTKQHQRTNHSVSYSYRSHSSSYSHRSRYSSSSSHSKRSHESRYRHRSRHS